MSRLKIQALLAGLVVVALLAVVLALLLIPHVQDTQKELVTTALGGLISMAGVAFHAIYAGTSESPHPLTSTNGDTK